MKTLTSLVVATALIAPSIASAQRVTTPRTFERHEANLAEQDAAKADKQAERSAKKGSANERRVRAAMAGRINLAAPAASAATASPN